MGYKSLNYPIWDTVSVRDLAGQGIKESRRFQLLIIVMSLFTRSALTHSLIGAFLYRLALRLPGNPIVNFVLLGGLESIPEHLRGLYMFRILEAIRFG